MHNAQDIKSWKKKSEFFFFLAQKNPTFPFSLLASIRVHIFDPSTPHKKRLLYDAEYNRPIANGILSPILARPISCGVNMSIKKT